jgi:glycerophosphoryl diester phosphodiesterase
MILLAGCSAPSTLPLPTAPSTLARSNTSHPTTSTASSSIALVAHRGGAGLGAENVLSTFQIGLNYNSDYLEMDVHLTKDGIPVIIHDATLDRTTNSTGPVSNFTFAQLLNLNAAAKYVKSNGERIPPLAEVLDLAKPAPAGLEVEIKVGADGKPYPGIEQKVMDEIVARDMVDRVKIMAFEFETLKRVRAISPGVKTVALMTTDYFRRMDISKPAAIIDDVSTYSANGIGVNKDLLTAALVDEAHRRKMAVGVWTVDGEAEMQKFIGMGVDSITTNRPDILKKVLGR